MSPLIWIGLLGTQPVYRVTNTLGLDREGNKIDQYEVHWPAIFPNIITPMCDPLQLDTTIRIHTQTIVLQNPKCIGYFNGANEFSPIYHIGFQNDEPVFRVSLNRANHSEGSVLGDFVIHDPLLFPNVMLAGCGPNQLDVTLHEKVNNVILGKPRTIKPGDSKLENNGDWSHIY
ncbi:unnamed protein product [Adineta steineri]|uniref:Uncharacterized protein n=1 Tax=Adineta steineri TaxID=433720 RepID=A0A819W8X4_9BILA|nr:unnamed protein product [Adineta steineri]CAF4120989.1 unnamed protein product [Adineta steineri]